VLGLALADRADFAPWADSAFGHRPPAYVAHKQALLQSILRVVGETFPSWRVERAELSTPLSTEHFTGSPDGATYGHYHSVAQMGRYRLPMQIRVRNLLQVGQCTGSPGICGAAMSAYAALGRVLGADRLVEELRAQ
jgi:all-trans-retinol 13,14-reductase